jgi:N-acetylneuraminic acid mutarotase
MSASPSDRQSQLAAGNIPAPRQEVASAATADGLYVAGGFDGSGRSAATVYRFRSGWSESPPLPRPLDHPSAAELGGRLYVAGGFSNGSASPALYSLEGGSWRTLASMRRARGALALVATGGRLFAIGGAGAADVAVVEAYDPGRNAWSDVSALPQPRNHLAGFSFDGKACAAGGRSPNSARVDCMDPATGTWSRLPDLPKPTSGAGAVVLDGMVIVAGGEDPGESRLVDQVARFQQGTWSSEPMLHPRHGIQLAVYEGKAWACGGADQPGYHAVGSCTTIA